MRHPEAKTRLPTLGEEPGVLLPVSGNGAEAGDGVPLIRLLDYGPERCEETQFRSIAEGLAYQPKGKVQWLNVYGLQEPEVLKVIGDRFGLHPLVLEDILNARQRPKLEDYGSYLFFAARVFHYQEGSGRLGYHQVYLVIGKGFVITFQNQSIGLFQGLRDRLHSGKGLARQRGADFLAYSLIDAIIDDYFGVLDAFTLRVEKADSTLLGNRDNGVLRTIHRLKHDSLRFRRALLPLRDALNQATRGDHPHFGDESRIYLRDAYDHTLHLIESLESSRDMVSGMLDLYLSNQSNRLNVQMRVLTVITIIFMPLTLIVGIYGMNFEYMPELHWRYGYFTVLAGMLVISSLLGYYFWKKRWI
ncbi:magnesium/cobalt transporter CorA [Crenobacter sp. SG2303]|uniref:Magnesium transport protein CorA n=1 Tax=Crenobacter oryzisoli TaxID=3056844 RepID=A0ABT7XJ87_9NEIS|nr:magnesium/cobalt transporter CorA [Crenobacter sp. SG2303]MDN0073848.1 magnesium/cobalt transporter CorA [Crenobacter sp. SG2303]